MIRQIDCFVRVSQSLLQVAGVLVQPTGMLQEARCEFDSFRWPVRGDSAELIDLALNNIKKQARTRCVVQTSLFEQLATVVAEYIAGRGKQLRASLDQRLQTVALGASAVVVEAERGSGKIKNCLQQHLVGRVRLLPVVLPTGDQHAQARCASR
jgi:hypothetical protein